MTDALVPISELTPEHKFYERLQELREFYFKEFGSEPQFFVRVPGRLNIIGEHVDYCGYPVLPMALEQCIVLAVSYNPDDTFLHLKNIEEKKFQHFKCDLSTFKIELPEIGGPEWYKYYLCGIQGIYDNLGEQLKPIGMSVALSGNIPPASGLSSSSALVSAAVLATAYVHKFPLAAKKLASIAACCERYIGTQGGGMDQAIAYLAKTGCAQFIEFEPKLNATSIELPNGACFVVANSLAEINKAASSDFNERVVECRLGARIIAKRMALPNWCDIIRFKQLQEALNCTLHELEEKAYKFLTKPIYTRADICQELNVTDQQLETELLTPNTRNMTTFKLRQRALHVIQESLRVQEFRVTCETRPQSNQCNGTNNHVASATYAEKLTKLSQLMRQSHHSLRDLYECSHPDLDQLIAISDSLGVGARLTGAGWGGCIVALCKSAEASEKYIHELKAKYFAKLPIHILEAHKPNDFRSVVFATFPRDGAELITMTTSNHTCT